MMTMAPRFSVSDFVAVVNQVLETAVPVVEVEGEVAEFTMRQQKFIFFYAQGQRERGQLFHDGVAAQNADRGRDARGGAGLSQANRQG